MAEPEPTPSLRAQAERAARRGTLDATVTAGPDQVTASGAVGHTSARWWTKAIGAVTAQRGQKPAWSAEVQVGARWLTGGRTMHGYTKLQRAVRERQIVYTAAAAALFLAGVFVGWALR